MPATRPAARLPMARAGLVLLALLGTAILFAAAMTRPLNYDEDQYIAAGALAQDLLPYRDFIYLQAPLYPFVLAAVFRVAAGYDVLAARGLTFVLMLGSGALLWHLVRRLGAGRLLAVLLLGACLTSPFLAAPMGNARNDALPLFLMLAGLALLLDTELGPERPWVRAAAALLFGLAVEAKVTYLFGPLVLGLHALGAPRRRLPPVLLGTAAAALPALLCWAACPEGFRFGLLGYHLVAPLDWYARNRGPATLLLSTKLEDAAGWLVLGGNLTLGVLAAAAAAPAILRRGPWRRPGPLLLALFAGSALLAAVPSPSWAMYYAALPPLLACCVAHAAGGAPRLARSARARFLFAAAAIPAAAVALLDAPDLLRLAAPGSWTGIAVHRDAEAVHALAPLGHVATLFPAEVMDANRVRPEFGSGPFVFRSAAAFPADQLARLHGLGPATLDGALAADPPAAVYAGSYPGLWRPAMDAPLVAWAEARHWHPVPVGRNGARLWLPP